MRLFSARSQTPPLTVLWPVLLLLTSSIVACPSTPADDDDDSSDGDDDDDDSADEESWPAFDEHIGLFNLQVWAPDRDFPDVAVFAHGVFAGGLGADTVYDGTARLALNRLPGASTRSGTFDLPAPDSGASVPEAPDSWAWLEQPFWYNSGSVFIGDLELEGDERYGETLGVWTYSHQLGWGLEDPGNGPFSFMVEEGGAFGMSTTEDVVVLPEPFAVTSHPELRTIRLRAGQGLELTWEASSAPAAYDLIWVVGPLGQFLARPGEASLSLTGAQLEAVGSPFEILVSRSIDSLVSLPEGSVTVRGQRARWLYGEIVPELTVSIDTIEPGDWVSMRIESDLGRFRGAVEVDLGEAVSTGTASVYDDGRYIIVFASALEIATLGPRTLTVTDDDGVRTLPDALWVVMPGSDTCKDTLATEVPVLVAGQTYYGTTSDLTDDYLDPSACTGYLAAGRDAVYAVELDAGEPLSATLTFESLDGVLLVIDDCASASEPLACADESAAGQSETVNFTAPGAGTYYLVVDSFDGATNGGRYTLELAP